MLILTMETCSGELLNASLSIMLDAFRKRSRARPAEVNHDTYTCVCVDRSRMRFFHTPFYLHNMSGKGWVWGGGGEGNQYNESACCYQMTYRAIKLCANNSCKHITFSVRSQSITSYKTEISLSLNLYICSKRKLSEI